MLGAPASTPGTVYPGPYLIHELDNDEGDAERLLYVNRMHRSIRRPTTFLAMGLTIILLAACSRGAGTGATASPSAGGGTSGVVLKVSQSDLGMILTDADGRTLYTFTKDTADKSACAADCTPNWPPLTVPSGASASAGDGTTGEWIHSLIRDDGTTQVSYGGHPLYHYAGDQASGDTNGQGVDGQWFALTGDGQLVQASASPSASASASTEASASESESESASPSASPTGYGY
jgi:predicted lipoprotein with Yx(FWY)xxD motif